MWYHGVRVNHGLLLCEPCRCAGVGWGRVEGRSCVSGKGVGGCEDGKVRSGGCVGWMWGQVPYVMAIICRTCRRNYGVM